MEIVFVKDYNYDCFELGNIDGFKFKPRSKFINNLEIVNKDLTKRVLSKKLDRDISKSTKAIKLMLDSNITEIKDCNIMINELKRIAGNIEKKYMKYFTQLEYFDLIKELYYLNMEILLKKKILEDNI